MAIDTAMFLGVTGVHMGLTLAVLAISVDNARNVGHDETARQQATEAEEQAQYAARRVTEHEAEHHGGHVEQVEP